MFDKAKQIWQLQKKAKAIQKELKETEVEVKSAEGKVKVIFNGQVHLQSVEIDATLLHVERKRDLEKALEQAIAEGISRVQAIAAEKMKIIAGDLNIPGL